MTPVAGELNRLNDAGLHMPKPFLNSNHSLKGEYHVY